MVIKTMADKSLSIGTRLWSSQARVDGKRSNEIFSEATVVTRELRINEEREPFKQLSVW